MPSKNTTTEITNHNSHSTDQKKESEIITAKNYIDGKWVQSSGKEFLDIKNPATEKVIGKCPKGTSEDAVSAIRSAKNAFKSWRETPVIDRVQVLFRLKALMEKHLNELIEICTKENGKILAESKGDVRRGIQMLETACGMPSLLMGKSLEDIASGIDCHAIRRPLGVFAGITPFNFPPMVPFWFWPFAIACGNTFVLKPSERVPLTQQKVFELIEEAGIPKGVMNLVNGSKDIVNTLCTHPDVAGISFVGSTPVAKYVYETATSHGKRVQALGGAKNFMVVLPDANMDLTAKTVFESCTGCAGQRCLAGSVILCVGDTYEKLQNAFVSKAKVAKIGDGLNPETDIGPVISEDSKNRIISLLDSAQKEGAKILFDGREGITQKEGYFLKPTIVSDVKRDMKIAKEEIFGPVICLGKVKNLDEAIEWLNSSEYGNTTSLFTSSGAAARKFSYEVDPSMIGINIGVPAPMAFFSFGGTKASFFGDIKAHGSVCADFYTDTKVTIERWVKDSSIW